MNAASRWFALYFNGVLVFLWSYASEHSPPNMNMNIKLYWFSIFFPVSHKIEAKYIFCIGGKAKISAVKIKNFDRPSKKAKPLYWLLNSKIPDVIYIPPGYANASKSISNDMKLLILSTSTLKQSLKDDFRFPENFWKI